MSSQDFARAVPRAERSRPTAALVDGRQRVTLKRAAPTAPWQARSRCGFATVLLTNCNAASRRNSPRVRRLRQSRQRRTRYAFFGLHEQ